MKNYRPYQNNINNKNSKIVITKLGNRNVKSEKYC